MLATADKLGPTVRLRPFEDQDQADASVPDLLISTVPAGAANLTPNGPWSARPPMAVLDVVYAPLADAPGPGRRRGRAIVVSGFAMLLHQAVAQVELMTGKSAPLEAMRAAGEAELAARAAKAG